MTSFGGQTVTFVKVTEDPTSRNRYNEPATITTSTDVPGCLFRSMTYKEIGGRWDPTDEITQRWRLTAPPVPAVLNASGTDEVIVDGVTYQIEGGVEVFYDFSGSPFKCTIICELQIL